MDKFEKGFSAIVIVAILANIVFWGAVIVVAIHFLGKVW